MLDGIVERDRAGLDDDTEALVVLNFLGPYDSIGINPVDDR